MDGSAREDLDRRGMAEQAIVKVWTIPAAEGSGPVTMTLRIPDVRIADSEGRYIIVSPRQSAIIGSRLESINDWLQYGQDEE